MSFSTNGYYVEKYIKCDNCGMLIHGDGIKARADQPALFCSDWCVEWSSLPATAQRHRLKIVLPSCRANRRAPAPTARPMDMVTMNILDSDHGLDLPGDGHPADEDVVFDDLQRGPRFHLRAGRCQRRHDRGRGVLPDA